MTMYPFRHSAFVDLGLHKVTTEAHKSRQTKGRAVFCAWLIVPPKVGTIHHAQNKCFQSPPTTPKLLGDAEPSLPSPPRATLLHTANPPCNDNRHILSRAIIMIIAKPPFFAQCKNSARSAHPPPYIVLDAPLCCHHSRTIVLVPFASRTTKIFVRSARGERGTVVENRSVSSTSVRCSAHGCAFRAWGCAPK